MTKNGTLQDLNKKKHLNFTQIFNPFNPLGFILISSFLIGCFIYLEDRTVFLSGMSLFGLSKYSAPPFNDSEGKAATAMAPAATVNVNGRMGFLDEGGDTCDIYDGNWVWDRRYPFYETQHCPFADNGFRCLENGRRDSYYAKWRWQPNGCDLPRFNATKMLEKLRNRRLAFIGDSIGRNQWESLLCLLATAIPNKTSKIYEVNGKPITKHRGFFIFRFEDYNCTVEYYSTPFLVVQGSAPKGSPKDIKMTLKVDQITWTAPKWKDADVLVFNSGHWWTYDKTIRLGCYFREGTEVKMDMNLTTAFQKSIETLVNFITTQVDTTKTQVIFRTYAPVHFRGGTWRSAGHCHQLKVPDFGPLPNTTEKLTDIISGVLSKHPQGFQVMTMMNVTPMTYRRQDGHTSVYNTGPGQGPAPINRQDCSHWCLPGVPDSWNELLYAIFLRREFSRSSSTQNS